MPWYLIIPFGLASAVFVSCSETGLSFYWVVGLMLVILIWILSGFNNQTLKSDNRGHLNIFLGAFILLSLITQLSLYSYFYPPLKIMRNADQHLFEHLGFSFINSLVLFDSEDPKQALFDQQPGQLSLKIENNKFELKGKGISTPIYIHKPDTIGDGSGPEQYVLDTLFNKNITNFKEVDQKLVASFTIDDTVSYKVIIKKEEKSSPGDFYIVETFKSDSVTQNQRIDSIRTKLYKGIELGRLSEETGTDIYLLRDIVVNPWRSGVEVKSIKTKFKLITPATEEERTETEKLSDGAKILIGLPDRRADIFILKNRSVTNSPESKGELLYLLSKKYPLRNDQDFSVEGEFDSTPYKLFITSSIALASQQKHSNGLVKNEGGYLFNIFEDEDNLNAIDAQVTYHSGRASRQAMQFSLLDFKNTMSANISGVSKIIRSNEPFELCTSIRGNTNAPNRSEVYWKMQFSNVLDANDLKAESIFWYLMIFLLLVLFRYLINYHPSNVTRIEMAIYVVLYVFIALRSFLIWRTSTYIPLDIGYERYLDLDKGMKNLYENTIFPLGAFLLYFTMIRFVLNEFIARVSYIKKIFYSITNLLMRIKFLVKLIEFVLGIFRIITSPEVVLSIVFITGLPIFFIFNGVYDKLERFFAILAPIGYYFFFDDYIIKNWKKRIHPLSSAYYWIWKNVFKITQIFSFNNERINMIRKASDAIFENGDRLRILLFLAVGIVIFLLDAGYSVMFFLFGLAKVMVSLTLGRKDYLLSRINIFIKKQRIKYLYWRTTPILWRLKSINFDFYLLLWVFILAFIIYNHPMLIDFFVWFLKQTRSPIILISSIVLLFALAYNEWRNQRKTTVYFSMFLLITLLVSGLMSDLLKEKIDRIQYRAEVLNRSVGEVLIARQFNSGEADKILRSALNQWLINFYQQNSPDLNDFWDGHYFQRAPDTDQGATYPTQLCDLVVPRYLIAEHGSLLPILLLVPWLLLCFVFYHSRSAVMKPVLQYSHFGIFLFLFVSALFVWMTATNRFTFFGQDFPLLSINSLVSVVQTLGLFAFVLYHNTEPFFEKKGVALDFSHFIFNRQFIIRAVIPTLILGSTVFFSERTYRDEISYLGKTPAEKERLRKKANEEFNVGLVVRQMQDSIVAQIQPKFKTFQDTLNKDSLILYRNNPGKYLQTFYDQIKGSGIKEQQPDAEPQYLVSALSYFMDSRQKESQKNKKDPNAFLHLRKYKNVDHIAVNSRYYTVEPPKTKDQRRWKGKLYAAPEELHLGLMELYSRKFVDKEEKVKYKPVYDLLRAGKASSSANFTWIHPFSFPGSWTMDGNRVLLIEYKNQDDNALYINGRFQKTTNNRNCIILKTDDLISLKSKKEIKHFLFTKEYPKTLVDNMWINGSYRQIYPLRDQLMWAYNIGKLLQHQLVISGEKRIDALASDSTTLDYALQMEVGTYLERISNPIRDKETFEELKKIRSELYGKDLDQLKNFINDDFKLEPRMKKNLTLKREVERLKNNINARLKRNGGQKIIEDCKNQIEQRLKPVFGVSVVALDGKGRIRLMGDYNGGHTDPNNQEDLNRFQNELYVDYDLRGERDFFGNMNLQRPEFGVGSTFKPIAYAAITSKLRLAWEGLSVVPIQNKQIITDSLKRGQDKANGLAYFAGHEFKGHYWKNISDLELTNEENGLTPDKYLAKSNNIYHGTMIMLGSFVDAEPSIKQFLDKVLMPSNNSISIKYRFPTIKYMGKNYHFKIENWPQFSQRSSILSAGLYSNFGIDPQPSRYGVFSSMGIDSNNKKNSILAQTFFNPVNQKLGLFTWAFPPRPNFYAERRDAAPIEVNGLTNPAVGGYPIEVTPLSMAEMGGKLYSFNRQYRAFIREVDAQSNAKGAYFSMDQRWKKPEQLFRFYQSYIYGGMRSTIQEGTAQGLKPFADSLLKSKYYCYAKTGTTGEGGDAVDKERSKRLMLVITNQPIHDQNIIDLNKLKDPKFGLRFYSIFITVDNYKGDPNSFWAMKEWENILKMITNSRTFTQYMQHGK